VTNAASGAPVVLIILDGFGIAEPSPSNAIACARTPVLDRLFATCPWSTLEAHGTAVGLPPGQMGNSEVGHLNIGAGRVVYQELTRIDQAVLDGTLAGNPVLTAAIDAAVSAGRAVHFMGLLSDGGVHSHQEHLYALIAVAKNRGARDMNVHAFLDGRDVAPTSGRCYVEELEDRLSDLGVGRIATVMGRYFAMDRDNHWDRVERAWRAVALAEGATAPSAVQAVDASYAAGVTDEFVEPTVMTAGSGYSGVQDGDAVIFFNFRPDRARELTRAFVCPEFEGFDRPRTPDVGFVCLTEYDPLLPAPVVFPKDLPENVLADVLAQHGLHQLHIAETEKYAHVTFFLNGGSEPPRKGEERILVPSPRIATYDLQPEMSAPQVTSELVSAIMADRADFYVVNYANCDMVGHTGVLEAVIHAVEAVDASVGAVLEALRAKGGSAIVTADHGNAECMLDETGHGAFTAHTINPVPFICVADGVADVRDGGRLADVAPSVCDLLGLPAPPQWTGRSLLVRG